MNITYEQVRKEVKELSADIVSSKAEVPSVLSNLKPTLLLSFTYFIFYFCCYFSTFFIEKIWLFVGLLSIFFWVFIALFISGYCQFFSMLPADAQKKYEIVRIFRTKARAYYMVWFACVFIAGVVSLFSMLNIIVLAGATVISTFALVMAFSFDISRYQISGLFGALGAVKESLK